MGFHVDFDPQKAGDWGTFIGSIVALLTFLWGIVTWPARKFQTKTAAAHQSQEIAATYVRIAEPDGSRNYLHVSDLPRLEEMFQGNRAFLEIQFKELKEDLKKSDDDRWKRLNDFIDAYNAAKANRGTPP